MKGYDRLSGIYDWLSQLVFARKLENASNAGLTYVEKDDSILIVGGGTGRPLQLLKQRGHSGRIVYVDKSKGMLSMASRFEEGLNIEFINEDILQMELNLRFDAIHLGFFLDQFNENTIRAILKKLGKYAEPGTIWIVSDFVQPVKVGRKMLLYLMYRFFRILTGIEATRLPDIPDLIEQETGMVPEKSAGNWIWYAVYRQGHN